MKEKTLLILDIGEGDLELPSFYVMYAGSSKATLFKVEEELTSLGFAPRRVAEPEFLKQYGYVPMQPGEWVAVHTLTGKPALIGHNSTRTHIMGRICEKDSEGRRRKGYWFGKEQWRGKESMRWM
jgi:hypothetical protein